MKRSAPPAASRRLLRHASKVHVPLAQNADHGFAARHALVHYPSGAVCTFIPKNGCSSLRISLAIANGAIAAPADGDWIHQNNATFAASLADLGRASYSFVFLRDPLERLYSAYIDKIVGRTVEAWQLVDQAKRRVGIEELTFERFIALLEDPRIRKSNNHWRPQVDFLVYEHYDDYFLLDRWTEASKRIEAACGLRLIDARGHTRHGRDQMDDALRDAASWAISPLRLLEAKETRGVIPPLASIYNDDLQQRVKHMYADDFAAVRDVAGK